MKAPYTILGYMAEYEIAGVNALHRQLGISLSHASDLVSGKRNVGRGTAGKLEGKTGVPWHQWITPPIRANGSKPKHRKRSAK